VKLSVYAQVELQFFICLPDGLGLDDLWVRLVLSDNLHDALLVVLRVEHLVKPVVPLLLVQKVDQLLRGERLSLGQALEQLFNVRPERD
jgi:hypothetical protein